MSQNFLITHKLKNIPGWGRGGGQCSKTTKLYTLLGLMILRASSHKAYELLCMQLKLGFLLFFKLFKSVREDYLFISLVTITLKLDYYSRKAGIFNNH